MMANGISQLYKKLNKRLIIGFNDQYGTEHYPALNPFVPEQIDVKAIVDYTDESGNYHSQPVFGFFYRDYQRIAVKNNPNGENMDDPDKWR